MACLGASLTESLGGAVLKGKGVSPGRLDILQEGKLKGAGAGRPHVLKDGPVGKKMGLTEQKSFGWNSGKKKEIL